MIGGIAANNASGMCCGTAQNSYQTLAGMRVVLADGTVLDTRDAASRAAFRARQGGPCCAISTALGETVRANEALAARIRHKFRMKNTTGYSLNALVDFTDPIDILAHLMIGSEGTLGFISEITYRTVPDHADKASALILFDDLETACRAVTLLKSEPVAAVELADRAALRSVEGKPGLPESLHKVGPNGAALLVETRAADPTALAAQVRADRGGARRRPHLRARALLDRRAGMRALLERAQGHVPVGGRDAQGRARRSSSRTWPFPCPRLAEATLDLQRLLAAHGYPDAIIFGHALEGNLHFVFTQDFNAAAEVARYRGFMDALCRLVVDKYDGSLKAEHGTGRNVAPFVELEWGAEAYALMQDDQAPVRPAGPAQSGRDPQRRSRRACEEPEAAARRATRSSTSASSAASASPSARRAGSRCRPGSASSAGARSRAASVAARMRRRRRRCTSSTTITASTPAPRADCAPPHVRSGSKPAC